VARVGGLVMRRSVQGRNLTDVRLNNRAAIFSSIRQVGRISRSELARASGLNPATVTHIVRELIDQGLVEEAGTKSMPRGRPMTMLRLRPDRGCVVAVSLSRQSVLVVLTDLNMQETVGDRRQKICLAQPVGEITQTIAALINSVLAEHPAEARKIIGAGINAPGVFDGMEEGVLASAPHLLAWPKSTFRDQIETLTGLPTFVDNDANAMALAEMWFGVAQGLSDFVCLLVDTGVGGSIVMGGDVYRGAHNAAGEIGHTTIQLDGPRCGCGNRGCLELYASPQAAVLAAQRAIQAGQPSRLSDISSGMSFASVVEAASQGDGVALKALESVGQALGAGIVNMLNSVDPEAVVIGGRICLAGDLVLNPVREVVEQRAFLRAHRGVPILMASLKEKALVMGAYCLVLREMITRPEISFTGSSLKLPLHGTGERRSSS
jgi:N-acetylglucosamine repressor